MMNIKSLLLSATATVMSLSVNAAHSQSTAPAGVGFCGQPAALNSRQMTFDQQPIDVSGEFVQLSRNEPRYIELSINAPVALAFATETGRIDTTLVLFDQNGQIIGSDDDGGGSSASRIVSKLNPGKYCLQVDKISDLKEPNAVVPVSITGAPGPDSCVKNAGPAVPLNVNSDDIITSHQLNNKTNVAIRLAAGTGVRIEARSPVFDTYLKLEDGIGQIIAEDDDGGDDTNSRLELAPVSEDGTYCVSLTSLGEEGGIYALSIAPISAASIE